MIAVHFIHLTEPVHRELRARGYAGLAGSAGAEHPAERPVWHGLVQAQELVEEPLRIHCFCRHKSEGLYMAWLSNLNPEMPLFPTPFWRVAGLIIF